MRSCVDFVPVSTASLDLEIKIVSSLAADAVGREIPAWMAADNIDDRVKAELLARNIWFRERPRSDDVHSCFQRCTEIFSELYQQVVDFLSSPELAVWRESVGYPSRNEYPPEDLIWHASDEMMDLLSKQDFKGLVEYFVHESNLEELAREEWGIFD